MLMLKLYPGQTIWIGEDIKVAEEALWDKGQPHETL